MHFQKLLYPFSLLYACIISIRNKFFDWQILASKSYTLPIISVGNITVGGTGKTPLSEYIIRLLKDDYKITLLSRGYKRKTKGALLANKSSSAQTIGDEPYQIKQKFPDINITVAEKRVEGMEIIIKNTLTDVVLMDDAYQHRYVKPGFSILVIDYNRPLWKDCVFPAGNLRETKNGQKRANLIVVNKCPKDMTAEEKDLWLKKVKALPLQHVFFTSINYGLPQPIMPENKISFPSGLPIVALAGIAQPQGFFTYLKNHYKVDDELRYPDHHHFSEKDLQKISEKILNQNIKALITTEKDAVRFEQLPQEVKDKSWYIPIQLKVLFEAEEQFENIIRNYVRNNKNNS